MESSHPERADALPVGRSDKKIDRLIALILFAVVFSVYLITLSPSVSFWDSGEFIAASYTLGIPHPPGTPLYVLLGRVFALLPLASVAIRVNLLSAIPSALAVAFLYRVLMLIAQRMIDSAEERAGVNIYRAGAAAGAMIAAFGSTWWTNAIESEVYALSGFVISVSLWILLKWGYGERPAADRRPLILIAYILSLSIGVHLGTYLALPAFVLFVFAVDRRAFIDWRFLALTVLFTLLGVTVHAYLPIRSTLNPIIDEANPETSTEMVDFLLRKQYKPSTPWIREAAWDYQIGMYWKYFKDQFGAVLPLLGAIGMAGHFRRDRKSFPLYATLFLITSLFLIFYMNFTDHEVRDRDYFFAPSFFFWAGWIGLGAAYAVEWLRRLPAARFMNGRAGMSIAIIFILLLPTYVCAVHFRTHDRRGNFIAREYAWNILNFLEKDALVFTNGDNDTFPLWYIQEVEGVRKDVRVVNLALLNTHWYIWQLKHLEPKIPISLSDRDIENLQPYMKRDGTVVYVKDIAVSTILSSVKFNRPIYFAVTVSDLMGLETRNLLKLEGLVFRLMPDVQERVVDIETTEKNLWERYRFDGILDRDLKLDNRIYRSPHQRNLITNYSAAFSRLAIQYRNESLYDKALLNLKMAGEISPNYRVYQSLMGPLLIEAGQTENAETFFLAQIEERPDSVMPWLGLGYIREQQKQHPEAEEYYRRGISLAPGKKEPYDRLFRMLASMGELERAKEVLTDWARIDPDDEETRAKIREIDKHIETRKGGPSP